MSTVSRGPSMRRRNTSPYTFPYAYIYLLCDPQTQEPRYVGQAWDPERRLASHRGASHGKSRHDCWIKALRRRELRPIMEIIDVVGIDEIDDAERFWYMALNNLGYDLLNGTIGGQRGYTHVQSVRDGMSAQMKERHAQWTRK